MRVIGIGDNVVDRYTNRRIMFPGGNAVNVAAACRGADFSAQICMSEGAFGFGTAY